MTCFAFATLLITLRYNFFVSDITGNPGWTIRHNTSASICRPISTQYRGRSAYHRPGYLGECPSCTQIIVISHKWVHLYMYRRLIISIASYGDIFINILETRNSVLLWLMLYSDPETSFDSSLYPKLSAGIANLWWLTRCVIVTTYGVRDLGQRWLGYWRVAPSHYMKMCWFTINEIHWNSFQGHFTRMIKIYQST